MKTLSAKYFRDKIILQRGNSSPDGYGSSIVNGYTNVKTVYGHLFNKTSQILNSAGQRIIQQDKAVIIRKTQIQNNYRIVIDNKAYSIINTEDNLKGTQTEITLEFVGFG